MALLVDANSDDLLQQIHPRRIAIAVAKSISGYCDVHYFHGSSRGTNGKSRTRPPRFSGCEPLIPAAARRPRRILPIHPRPGEPLIIRRLQRAAAVFARPADDLRRPTAIVALALQPRRP